MPYRTRYGKHYHMTEGCHGATIPCDTGGLTPCSDCCGAGMTGRGDGAHGLSGDGNGTPAGVPSPSSQGDGQWNLPELDLVLSPPEDGTAEMTITAEDLMLGDAQMDDADWGNAGPMSAPEVSLAPDGDDQGSSDVPEIEGLDYPGRGEGWRLRQRGRKYETPWGNGYASLTRRQAGIVYGAVKRGDVSLDQRHTREMYDLVGVQWRYLDLHGRSVMQHVNAAVGHIVEGRMELAQAELDGHDTDTVEVPVGTRKVEVTEDNWLDFALDIEHEYEIGDVAEETVTKTVWRIRPEQDEY